MDIEHIETIAAIATPPGKGGVGIIRISGRLAAEIAAQITQQNLNAKNCSVHVDSWIKTACRYRFRHSPLLSRPRLLYRRRRTRTPSAWRLGCLKHAAYGECWHLGARLARPGEFTERAYSK